MCRFLGATLYSAACSDSDAPNLLTQYAGTKAPSRVWPSLPHVVRAKGGTVITSYHCRIRRPSSVTAADKPRHIDVRLKCTSPYTTFRCCLSLSASNRSNVYGTVTQGGRRLCRVCGEVWQLQPKVVQKVQQHVSYEFIWIRSTCDYI